jgi:ribosomal protein S18 acetylase RimI-like enzyme
MVSERDLTRLLKAINPKLHQGVFVFCELPDHLVPEGLEVLAMFQEDEATTVVVAEEQAARTGLLGRLPSAWITIGASSDLAAVGFLAVITARMAAAGISVNVVSASRHDHLFVPVAMADKAMAVLATLDELRRPRRIGPIEETASVDAIVEVRPAELTDAKALVGLWQMCGLQFESGRVMVELENCARLNGELVLVATAGADIVGSLWASYDGRRGWIQRLATHPTRRGRGIARALVAEAEGRLAGLGATKVNLLIEPDNASVGPFYESLGYERDELIFMERWLDRAMGV